MVPGRSSLKVYIYGGLSDDGRIFMFLFRFFEGLFDHVAAMLYSTFRVTVTVDPWVCAGECVLSYANHVFF